ncbi:MAG: Rv1355c family protein, partial [Nannocystaceae bacterium]
MPDADQWYPLIFDRSDSSQREQMDELMGTGQVIHVDDTIEAQIVDLIEARHPSKRLEGEALESQKMQVLNGRPRNRYGCWVYFPWNRRMVHLLPADAFSEIRADRNRNKITAAEQVKLGRLKIALAGLSVGNAVATTIALEGLCGELRLADFDTLELSNMNRIRCGVHHIGLRKAVICARQIFEQNPFARLVLFTDGVTEENIDDFVSGTDLVIDECDSLVIKVLLREEAKKRRIPVLMETSDRGLLDVERFDLEPERPILHGLLGSLTSSDVAKIPPQARLGLILQIVGGTNLSPRALASLLELGQSLRGLSQLGSDVTLGGATTAIAVRQIALGVPVASGRAYIDVSQKLKEMASPSAPPPPSAGAEHRFIRKVVEQAVMAPSRGNQQPWKFVYDGDLQVFLTKEKTQSTGGDVAHKDALLAIGALLENVEIVADSLGKQAVFSMFPQPSTPELVARVAFVEASQPSGLA